MEVCDWGSVWFLAWGLGRQEGIIEALLHLVEAIY